MVEHDPLTQFIKVFLFFFFLWNMKTNTWNQAMFLHFIILIKYFIGAADIRQKKVFKESVFSVKCYQKPCGYNQNI